MEPSDYKHVALGLIFLKYISDAFEAKRAELLKEELADAEEPEEYLAENVFWVPKEARWSHLQAKAKQTTIGKDIDDAMLAIEANNASLKRARSIVVDDLKKSTLVPILRENIAKEALLLTDEASQYQGLATSPDFAGHDWVIHSAGEYLRLEAPEVHTNTVEGFYSTFKRGMKGVYHHCGKQHLHRYAAEFDFRYNHRAANGVDDAERAAIALQSIVRKRLTYAS